jgi:hypothetical protein
MAKQPRPAGKFQKPGRIGQLGVKVAQEGNKKKTSSLKNRIRSVERLLRKASLRRGAQHAQLWAL